jgi:hypothetical protein
MIKLIDTYEATSVGFVKSIMRCLVESFYFILRVTSKSIFFSRKWFLRYLAKVKVKMIQLLINFYFPKKKIFFLSLNFLI